MQLLSFAWLNKFFLWCADRPFVHWSYSWSSWTVSNQISTGNAMVYYIRFWRSSFINHNIENRLSWLFCWVIAFNWSFEKPERPGPQWKQGSRYRWLYHVCGCGRCGWSKRGAGRNCGTINGTLLISFEMSKYTRPSPEKRSKNKKIPLYGTFLRFCQFSFISFCFWSLADVKDIGVWIM